jgi:hypothetical protein
MKEDYLWNKTGSDPAIEKLEKALRGFSYEESAQPVLPVIVVPEKKAFRFRFAPFAFAVAACLALAVISWSVWKLASNTSPVEDRAAGPAPGTVAPAAPGKPGSGDKDTPATRETRQVAQVTPRPKIRRGRTLLKTIPAEIKPKFTREEIYAYDQLMLALSITSDKLNLVREKAIGEKN